MQRAPLNMLHEVALLTMACSGFLAMAASQRLGAVTITCCCAAYGARLWWLLRSSSPLPAPWLPALLTLAALAGEFAWHADKAALALAALVLVAAWSTGRARALTAALAFLELTVGALLASGAAYFACLAVFVASAMAALASGEIRRSLHRPVRVARFGPSRLNARLTAFSLSLGLAVMVLTGGLFLILPRTARLLADRLPLLPGPRLTRLSPQVGLGGIGRLKSDERAVLHVKFYSQHAPLGMKWRGSTLSAFDGRVWSASPEDRGVLRADRGTVAVADGWQRRRAGARALYRVEFHDLDDDTLFVAGTPEFVNVGSGRLLQTAASTFRLASPGAGPVRYDVSSFLEPGPAPLDARAAAELTAAERERCLRLPRLDARVAQLAAQDAAGAAGDLDRARDLEQHLRGGYGYTLQPPASLARDPLADFLFERRAGHCEDFASAMAAMLRTQGIPARLVTGFESGVFNPYSGLLTIRAADAHSWVEAFIAGRGWTAFDPTPSAAEAAPAWLADLRLRLDAVDSFWRDWVLDYDLARQVQLADRLQQSNRAQPFAAWWRWIASHAEGSAMGVVLAGLLLLLAWKLRGRRYGSAAPLSRGAPNAARIYGRMLQALARRGLHKAAWQTPEEFAGSCRDERLAKLLEDFTGEYLRMRFGGAADGGLTQRLRTIEAHLNGSR